MTVDRSSVGSWGYGRRPMQIRSGAFGGVDGRRRRASTVHVLAYKVLEQ